MKKIAASTALVAVIIVSAFITWKQVEIMSSSAIAEPSSSETTVTTGSVIENVSVAAAASSASKIVTWQTTNYPRGTGVDINLIRKISDSPASFSFVRKIVQNTANDGSELWTPAQNESGTDLYIEVTCSSSVNTSTGCQTSSKPVNAN
jgi:hypothetical protein